MLDNITTIIQRGNAAIVRAGELNGEISIKWQNSTITTLYEGQIS